MATGALAVDQSRGAVLEWRRADPMAFAAPKQVNGAAKMQTKFSTWTPLNHAPSNDKVFEERRELVAKWFERWTDTQRRRVLEEVLSFCSERQLRHCEALLSSALPQRALDPARALPRVLCLYIFAHLDPRSLCRAAQVCWYWRHLSESDCLWMPKCLRFGWSLGFSPTPFEQGLWKRHYIQAVHELHCLRPKTPPEEALVVADVQPLARPDSQAEGRLVPGSRSMMLTSARGGGTRGSSREMPPWRASNPRPVDTLRYNYLDNDEPVDATKLARWRRGGPAPDMGRTSLGPDSQPRSTSGKLRKAQSLVALLSLDKAVATSGRQRPAWAGTRGETPPPLLDAQHNAGVRPAPARRPPSAAPGGSVGVRWGLERGSLVPGPEVGPREVEGDRATLEEGLGVAVTQDVAFTDILAGRSQGGEATAKGSA
ncbi:F-box only protein 16-like isoform X1 [Lethenteron reissneri]|uniref:F-box only protein 16-like isoform X1 n=2 Tax=Lethenteron reissneri TaxID=7753 RepID=UPI002AB6588B|nr:F-box only protein 16-like isoform X1 [Lethenteron reissneri]